MDNRLQIMELFGPTIQGEGIMTGTVTHFLRTGGCSLRCSWCDSLFAVLPEEIKKYRIMMDVGEIYDKLTDLAWAPYVTFTGGDPCLQTRLGDLIPRLNIQAGMKIAVETQGMYFPNWLKEVDVITFSPKGPSSGNIVDIADLSDWLSDNADMNPGRRPYRICIKIVCFDRADYDYALDVYEKIPDRFYDAFYFTAGTPQHNQKPMYQLEQTEEDLREKTDRRIADVLMIQQGLAHDMLNTRHIKFSDKVHLGCQQHVLLWPDKEKGV